MGDSSNVQPIINRVDDLNLDVNELCLKLTCVENSVLFVNEHYRDTAYEQNVKIEDIGKMLDNLSVNTDGIKNEIMKLQIKPELLNSSDLSDFQKCSLLANALKGNIQTFKYLCDEYIYTIENPYRERHRSIVYCFYLFLVLFLLSFCSFWLFVSYDNRLALERYRSYNKCLSLKEDVQKDLSYRAQMLVKTLDEKEPTKITIKQREDFVRKINNLSDCSVFLNSNSTSNKN